MNLATDIRRAALFFFFHFCYFHKQDQEYKFNTSLLETNDYGKIDLKSPNKTKRKQN